MIIGYPSTIGTGRKNAWPFDALFEEAVCVNPDDVRQRRVDALVVWGGEDISPSYYNEVPFHAYSDFLPSRRDHIEAAVIRAAIDAGIPIIGVCRGAQLVCALSGGKLVQHVNNHGGRHGLSTVDGRELSTTSVHHQMMWPFQMPENEYKLIAWASENRSDVYYFREGDVRSEVEKEPEIVYFPRTRALAIQGHPEFCGSRDDEFVKYSLELTQQLMEGNL